MSRLKCLFKRTYHARVLFSIFYFFTFQIHIPPWHTNLCLNMLSCQKCSNFEFLIPLKEISGQIWASISVQLLFCIKKWNPPFCRLWAPSAMTRGQKRTRNWSGRCVCFAKSYSLFCPPHISTDNGFFIRICFTRMVRYRDEISHQKWPTYLTFCITFQTPLDKIFFTYIFSKNFWPPLENSISQTNQRSKLFTVVGQKPHEW